MFKPRSLARKLAGRTRLTTLAAFLVVLAVAVPVFAAMNDFTSTNNGDTAGTTVVVAKPSGLAVGDVMVASVAYRGPTTTSITAPSVGWALIAKRTNTQNPAPHTTLATYWKTADNADVAATNFTWTLSVGARAFGGIARYDDVDGSTNPVLVNASTPSTDSNQGASANPTAPSVTTPATAPGAYVTAIYAMSDGTAITAGPPSMSPLYNNARTTGHRSGSPRRV